METMGVLCIYIYIWVYITCNMMGVYKVNFGCM